jgi:hypothetical protein
MINDNTYKKGIDTMIDLRMKIIDGGDYIIINKPIEVFEFKIRNIGDGLNIPVITLIKFDRKFKFSISDSEKENYTDDLTRIKDFEIFKTIDIVLERNTTKTNPTDLINEYTINFLMIKCQDRNTENYLFETFSRISSQEKEYQQSL